MEDSIEYALKRIHNAWKINSYSYDGNDKLLFKATDPYEKQFEAELEADILISLRNLYRQRKVPVMYMEKHEIYYLGFEDEKGRLYAFGPVSSGNLTASQLSAYRQDHKILLKSYRMPQLALSKAVNCLAIACFMITGMQLNEEDILRPNNSMSVYLEADMVAYQLYQYEEEKSHLSFEEERKWLELISEGRLGKSDTQIYQNAELMERVGTMAENNALKQTEYTMVAAITLATRAAIYGGVPPFRMYQLSDLYLQRLSKCTTAIDMLNVYAKALEDYNNEVLKSKAQAHYSDYVEQCKDYIAKNLYKKISISAMAKDLGVNRSYLSRKFSELEGMTILEYLRKERLTASANLLIYSEESIGNIAYYMSFSSTSHFGELFKKSYGVTPAQYRSKNKIKEFISRK